MKKLFIVLSFVFIILEANYSNALVVEFEKDSRLPIVLVQVAVKSGSVSDPVSTPGLTNFLTEMLLRGTQNKNKDQIDLTLDQIGATLSVSVRSEMLYIYGSVLSNELPSFLDLLKEILESPSFPKKEMMKLKKEIVSDIARSRDSDRSLVRMAFDPFFFGDHPYGNQKIGTERSVMAIKKEDLELQYKKLFQSNQLVVVGSGDAEPRTLVQWASGLRLNPNVKGSITPTRTPVYSTKKRVLIINKPERTQAQIMIGHPGTSFTDPRYYSLSIANHIFGGGSFSARLMQEIRVKKGWSYGAYSYNRYGTQPHSWSIYYFPEKQSIVASLEKISEMLVELKEKGVTNEEFSFTKESLIQSAGFDYDTPKKRVENALIEKIYNLPAGFFRNYANELKKVDISQVNSDLKNFLDLNKIQIVIVATATPELVNGIAKALGVSKDDIQLKSYKQVP